eukprot:scaffold144404_cov26-Tisochrysis_lutea.AAC.3
MSVHRGREGMASSRAPERTSRAPCQRSACQSPSGFPRDSTCSVAIGKSVQLAPPSRVPDRDVFSPRSHNQERRSRVQCERGDATPRVAQDTLRLQIGRWRGHCYSCAAQRSIRAILVEGV